MILLRCLTLLGMAISLSVIGLQSNAEEISDKANDIEYKFTPSYYDSSDGNHAVDLNLRATLNEHTGWIGIYRDKNNYQQIRTGYERRDDFKIIRTVISIQEASGGFLGGSINAEIGKDTYGIVGFGRTNLRDYYNLNFDPNDAITFGIGSRALDKTELSLFHIWDDRLGTQQHVTHAIARYSTTTTTRWTVDASYKHGLSTGGNYVAGYAVSITYDFGDWFARLAHDRYVNFTDTSQNRFSFGRRF